MIKERPILMNSAMVLATLSGYKTQTRRIITPQPMMVTHAASKPWIGPPDVLFRLLEETGKKCKYGKAGDRLYVRETFIHIDDEDDKFDGMGSQTYYRASEMQPEKADEWIRERGLKWTPSIHMPRKNSRINLEVVDVSVEQLQDISDADALAEGVDRTNTSIPGYAIERYRRLWESINGAGSWDANPWVWVIKFKEINGK